MNIILQIIECNFEERNSGWSWNGTMFEPNTLSSKIRSALQLKEHNI